MKIGILTYHRSHNYGAMLQAFALRKVISDFGNDVFFIDYWPQHQINIYRLFSWEDFFRLDLIQKVRYVKNFLKTIIPKRLRKTRFNMFFRDNISPFCRSPKESYDVVIYGSDQIWRKQQWEYGYNPIYFGKNDFITKKNVSYAASIGILPTDRDDIQTVLRYVKYLDIISVRESELKDFLIQHGLTNVEQTVDPTLLLEKKEWEDLAGADRIIKHPYLLYYNLMKGSFIDDNVYSLAEKLHLQVIELCGVPSRMPSVNKRTIDGPYEFLNLVRFADCVITSSFHGLVFSIIFNRPFVVAFEKNSGRATSLLKVLSLSDCMIEPKQHFFSLNKEIDWSMVNSRLEMLKDSSLGFIRNSINA